MIKGHGNDIYSLNAEPELDYSTNVLFNEYLYNQLCNNILTYKNISNYPEPNASSLQNKIALYHNLKPDNIQVTNGSTEAFYLIAQLFRDKKSVIFTPSFAEYEDACRVHKHQIKFISNKFLSSDLIFDADLVWIGNPNNPDGKIYSPDFISELCKKNPGVVFVIDEAFAELCYGFYSSVSALSFHQNLVIIRSFTKSFGIPGIRLGYIISSNKIYSQTEKIKIPWNVNTIAIETGKYILDNYNNSSEVISRIYEESEWFQNKLDELEYLQVVKSPVNFFLVKLLKGESAKLKKYLLEKYNILIRDASNFRELDNSWIRLAVLKREENKFFVFAIKRWLEETH